ncbi:hypothetical protein PR202_gb25457 [Eleusine coracana subsp. coracana]|uniref:Uncharacterized protein n=1 Tax=Eleusine coracana subsp. coracana TaxID=191504 RepID=A0AAV5FNK1_ELECO|nr:hypothetical protein PR202_gb25457 [Eleusine coracana subsp. coracana]
MIGKPVHEQGHHNDRNQHEDTTNSSWGFGRPFFHAHWVVTHACSATSDLHADRDGLLAVVEVAEPTDELGLIQGINSDLHMAHHGHVTEEGNELGGGGGDVPEGWVGEVSGRAAMKAVAGPEW